MAQSMARRPRMAVTDKYNAGAPSGAAPTENPNTETATGNMPFKIDGDGLVEVVSEKRSGKPVIGATGDIITFDNQGYAKVKVEDALHFAKIPGFSFK